MKRNPSGRSAVLALQLLMTICLAACGFSTTEELNVWLANQRRSNRAPSKPLDAPRVFEAEPYLMAGEVDPFAMSRIVGDAGLPTSVVTPVKSVSAYDLEIAGERRDLEKVPLDAVEYKGTLSQDGVPVALVSVQKRLHQVNLGDYVGPNRGKVMQINAQEILLRELEQDAAGRWTPKTTVLAVSRGGK